MAEKVLNIKLNYKGKNLDIAKYKRDFLKSFYIGSNKNLFWQILDPNFPDKFLLVQCENDKFVLNLHQGMEVSVRKGDQVLDSSKLKQAQLISGSQLTLAPDTTGSISFSQNWEIAYEFQVPYKIEFTAEQRQVISQLSHKTETTAEARFSRNLLVAGVIFTVAGMLLFNMFYKPQVIENTLQNRLEASQKMAQYVTAEVQKTVEKSTEAENAGAAAEAAAKAAAEAAANAKKDAASQGKQTKSTDVNSGAIESKFGFNPGATQSSGETRSARVIAVTTERDLVAQGLGGGGGGGKGKGGVGPGPGTAGGGSRAASAFNVAPTGSRSAQNVGELFKGNINVAGARGYKEIDASALGGKTGKIQAQRIVSSSQIGAVRSRFVSAGIVAVKETEIASSSPAVKAELGNVRNYVSTYKPQLQNLFITESQIRDMYGALEFTIYINEGGAIAGVEIKPKAGSYFTDSFLQKAQAVIMKWKIPVNKQVTYIFSYQFIKN